MPFVCETIPAGEFQKKAATPFSKDHITISPLGRWQSPLGKRLLLTPCFMPTTFRQYADVIHNFDVYPDDVWLISFPTATSNTIAEILWLLMNNVNMDAAESVPLSERCIFMEQSAVRHPKLIKSTRTSVEIARRQKSPRLISTHLPIALLPKQLWKVKPRIVYVARNPTDIAMEYYQLYRLLHGYQGSLCDFCELFLSNHVHYGPFHSHVTDFWDIRDQSNILFLHYEDKTRDFAKFVQSVATFLNDTPILELDCTRLENFLSEQHSDDGNDADDDEYKAGAKLWKTCKDEVTSDARDLLHPIVDKWSAEHLENTSLKFIFDE